MTTKEFGEKYDCHPSLVRRWCGDNLIDYSKHKRENRGGYTFEIILTKKTLKFIDDWKNKLIKPKKVEKDPAWDYRNDAMGNYCSVSLLKEIQLQSGLRSVDNNYYFHK